ncbi:probable serine/threonine-protein kinase nek2 [Agrilus planipennis]|uniref:non-specific serine/threonine protein kinase n=1 Tax=Agrilus planipennis TaxID=224129 RepID=A0A1W4WLD1_AGRPL|nr:probable serine/threonine-protein kinase nek2 [Agrilus planipennis]
MLSNHLEDYEVLSILGEDTSSSCYKVKSKVTNDVYIWRAISCEDMSKEEIKSLLNKITHYQESEKSYSLNLKGHIHQKDPNIIYLITEYCSRGSLMDIIKYCQKNTKRICENFMWKLLYQLSCILKTISVEDVNKIHCGNTFVDSDDKIKIFTFEVKETQFNELLEPKVVLGHLVLSLCTLETDVKKQNCENMCNKILDNFSNELIEIISFILRKQTRSDEVVNAILCHPTVLLKSSKPPINKNFYEDIYQSKEKYDSKTIETKHNENVISERENFYNEKIRLQIENIKNRETYLKNQEQKLMEKEFELKRREKKVALLEKLSAEKYSRAELYLKTAKENRTSKVTVKDENVEIHNATDASFSADCGDTSILPTSSKFDLNKFKKPPAFTRTFSERHVRFKGHSPLKEKEYNRKGILRNSFMRESKHETNSSSEVVSWCTLSSESNSEKSLKFEGKEKKKSLFPSLTSKRKSFLKEKLPRSNSEEFKETGGDFSKTEVRPISWTEDSKKQAFELLKIMNSVKDKENIPIRHTKL